MQLRRALGLFDVVLFFVVACTNLQWVASAAAAGPGSLAVWLIGAVVMFVPIAVAVTFLSRAYPQEGGMYVWARRAFGPFAGYMTGWTYWCSNVPYFPALLYFMAGNALFVSSGTTQALSASPVYFITVSLFAFALAAALNLIGLDISKWLNNVGAVSRFVVTFALIAMGIIVWQTHGSATTITPETLAPSIRLKDVIFWSVIAFAWTGPEAIPFLAGEVRDARRTIPFGLLLAIPGIALIYIIGTASVLVTVAPGHVSGLYGVMQAIASASARIGLPWLTGVLAVLVAISCLGSTGAWLGIAARIPFVAGVDRYLPRAFAYVHPRTGAPVVALLAQVGICVLFILLGQGGTTVKGAYDVLVSATVLITMIPFFLLFASAMKLRANGLVIAFAIVGMCTTAGSMVLALIPAADEADKPLAVAKVVVLTIITLAAGGAFYYLGRRNLEEAPADAISEN